ncbi:formimidoylglutamase [Roseivirga sp. BDSF3-8]|uniref:formimidoylglutamase n=1 Tax=Roseivirga sp. BDSF3-8 TaxID=3241598 RepID=UPI003531E970
MDLKIFFSSIPEESFRDNRSASNLLKYVKVNFGQMPDYREADIALIGIGLPYESEEGGLSSDNEYNEKPAAEASMAIRKQLYALKKGVGPYKVVDLGNIRPGMDEEDTTMRLKEVCAALLSENTMPVILGGSHAYTYGQYAAYEDIEKLVSVLCVDSILDMEEDGQAPLSRKHVQKLLLHEPNYLFNFTLLAYQAYLTDPAALTVLEKLYFECFRIGYLRQHLQEMEPVVRNADMLSFDAAAIRIGDAPGCADAQPFGMTGEEACQVAWYAGTNDKLSSAGFYGYEAELDDDRSSTAKLIAVMVWYFIEGYYHRKDSEDFRSNDYLKYVVSMPSEPETLTFFKSKKSDKWWMEVPHPDQAGRFARNRMVPCSYTDYEKASKGEVPDRWLNTYAKLV